MAVIFGEGKIFLKIAIRYSLDTPWIENFVEIAPYQISKKSVQ